MTAMRSVVLAYQEIGYVSLEAMLKAGADVAAVLTHEDDPEEEVWFRSVARLAESWGVPVRTPEGPNAPEVVAWIRELSPDFIFSFYYRHLLSPEILSAARLGAYNLHGSLLPRYRGRAPINWVLVHGETETGLTLHRMTPRPDAGPIMAQVVVPIAESDDVRGLYAKMTAAAAELVGDAWPKLAEGRIEETPQDEGRATYFGRRRPADGKIDWTRSAREIYNLCRAVTHPYPGAFTGADGRKLYVWSSWYDSDGPVEALPGVVLGWDARIGLSVACGEGTLFIRSAQWDGQSEQTGEHLINLNIAVGSRLGLD